MTDAGPQLVQSSVGTAGGGFWGPLFFFTIILLWMMLGLRKAISLDILKRQSLLYNMNTTPAIMAANLGDWKDRVSNLVENPGTEAVSDFIDSTAKQALGQIAHEFKERGLEVELHEDNDHVKIEVVFNGGSRFVYGIQRRRYEAPSFTFSALGGDKQDSRALFTAEVFLAEGGQGYNVMGYSQEQIICDVLDHYEKHVHYLSLVR